MTMVIVDTRTVCGGVDTHLDFHVAAVLDQIGGLLGVETFETTEAGYRKLLEWLEGFGTVSRVGVEGISCVGDQMEHSQLPAEQSRPARETSIAAL